MTLGGLKMRGEREMRDWLAGLQRHGLDEVMATFVGYGDVHDRWNGRRGDFDFLIMTIRTAIELGLSVSTLHILVKSSLPIMEELFDRLDALTPTGSERSVRPAYYSGHGVHREDERLTESDRDILTPRIAEAIGEGFVLRAEREWVDHFRTERKPHRVSMRPSRDNAAEH